MQVFVNPQRARYTPERACTFGSTKSLADHCVFSGIERFVERSNLYGIQGGGYASSNGLVTLFLILVSYRRSLNREDVVSSHTVKMQRGCGTSREGLAPIQPQTPKPSFVRCRRGVQYTLKLRFTKYVQSLNPTKDAGGVYQCRTTCHIIC